MLRSALLELGHDVLSASERFPQASDETLLAHPRDDGRVLITEDKDFGELVFLRGLRGAAIFFRLMVPVFRGTPTLNSSSIHSTDLPRGR